MKAKAKGKPASRNRHAIAPIMAKGHAHERTKKAQRQADKKALSRLVRDSYPAYFMTFCRWITWTTCLGQMIRHDEPQRDRLAAALSRRRSAGFDSRAVRQLHPWTTMQRLEQLAFQVSLSGLESRVACQTPGALNDIDDITALNQLPTRSGRVAERPNAAVSKIAERGDAFPGFESQSFLQMCSCRVSSVGRAVDS